MTSLLQRLRNRGSDKQAGLRFLVVLEWATARQQLALEEWNDGLAQQSGADVGDELAYSIQHTVDIWSTSAPDLLPIAQQRLASAVAVRDEFAKLKAQEMPDLVVHAIAAWASVFEHHLRRCESAVQKLQAMISGEPVANDDDLELLSAERRAMLQAGEVQTAMQDGLRITASELRQLMLAACNDLRLQLGKQKLSDQEYIELHQHGLAGDRPRFFD